MIDNPSKIITIKDVMDILSVLSKKNDLYIYLTRKIASNQQGRLAYRRTLWIWFRRCGSVKKELKNPGLTTKEVAQRLDIYVTTVSLFWNINI